MRHSIAYGETSLEPLNGARPLSVCATSAHAALADSRSGAFGAVTELIALQTMRCRRLPAGPIPNQQGYIGLATHRSQPLRAPGHPGAGRESRLSPVWMSFELGGSRFVSDANIGARYMTQIPKAYPDESALWAS